MSNHIESAPSEGGVTTMERLKKRKNSEDVNERGRERREGNDLRAKKKKKQDEEIDRTKKI